MKTTLENLSGTSEQAPFISEMSSQLTKLSDIINAYLQSTDDSGCKDLDYNDVLEKFRKHEIETIDSFCENYILENLDKNKFSHKEVTETVQRLRTFLFSTKRNSFMN